MRRHSVARIQVGLVGILPFNVRLPAEEDRRDLKHLVSRRALQDHLSLLDLKALCNQVLLRPVWDRLHLRDLHPLLQSDAEVRNPSVDQPPHPTAAQTARGSAMIRNLTERSYNLRLLPKAAPRFLEAFSISEQSLLKLPRVHLHPAVAFGMRSRAFFARS